VEGRVQLHVGDVYRQQGKLSLAGIHYRDAEEMMARSGETRWVVQSEAKQASLAVLNGRFGDAQALLIKAQDAAHTSLFAAQLSPVLSVTEAQLLLTIGDYTQAEARFNEACAQATAQQEPLLAADAVLGVAQVQLAHGELATALTTFLEAGRQYQQLESTSGDGDAVLGVAQVSIGQAQWDEALQRCDEALIRFNQSDDALGKADTLLAQGLAQRGKGEIEEAETCIAQALLLYQQQQQPLGEADAHYERAGLYLIRLELDNAASELQQAIASVERVMNTLSNPHQRSMFLHQYLELYAQAAITDVRRNAHERARTLLQNVTRVVGAQEIVQHLKAYEETVQTSGDDITEAEVRANKDLLKRLGQLRKGLR
jgi:tetratricopeptide (TPR) repeat protein